MHAALTLLLLSIIASIKALILPLEPLSPRNLTTSYLHNGSLTLANPTLTYRVPETQTILYVNYFPHFQIPREDLITAIRNIRNRMANHIKDKGDGWLLPKDDPIIETILEIERRDWQILIQSSPVAVHLTYGVVLEVMDGWENLINGEVGPCQIFAAIQNEKRGQVGRLRMLQPGYSVESGELSID